MSIKSDNFATSADQSSMYQSWRTPEYIFEAVRECMGGIDLDPCTDEDNPVKAGSIYTMDDDGLVQPWFPKTYVNPPYKELKRWCEKIAHEVHGMNLGNVPPARPLAALLPMRSLETRYLQETLWNSHLSTRFWFRGRVGFIDADGVRQKGNTKGSILWFYGVDAGTVYEVFRKHQIGGIVERCGSSVWIEGERR